MRCHLSKHGNVFEYLNVLGSKIHVILLEQIGHYIDRHEHKTRLISVVINVKENPNYYY